MDFGFRAINDLPCGHWDETDFSGLLKFDMKIFVNLARLEIDQLFTQARGGGIRVLCTHF